MGVSQKGGGTPNWLVSLVFPLNQKGPLTVVSAVLGGRLGVARLLRRMPPILRGWDSPLLERDLVLKHYTPSIVFLLGAQI